MANPGGFSTVSFDAAGTDVTIRIYPQDLANKFTKVPETVFHELKSIYFGGLLQLTRYPPIPTGSKYIRTYMLRASWGNDSRLSVAQARFINNMPYASLVQGEDQTWFHAAHGWRTTDDIFNEKKIVADLNKALAKALGGVP